METDNTALASPDDANPDNDDIATSITELQNVLLGTESIEKFVQELAVQAAHLVAGSLSCGITLRRGSQNTTVACSDELATAVNDLQYQLLEGPILTALERRARRCASTTWPPRPGGPGSPRRLPSAGSCPACPCRSSPRTPPWAR